MNDAIRQRMSELVALAAPSWAGEAEIVRSYLAHHRSVAGDIRFLASQAWKETRLLRALPLERRAESLASMIRPSDGELQDIPVPETGPSPEDVTLYAEFSGEVQEALAELPEVYRAAIVMCDLEQQSYAAIAAAQGTTIGTVRSRIHRARKLLRDILIRRGRL